VLNLEEKMWHGGGDVYTDYAYVPGKLDFQLPMREVDDVKTFRKRVKTFARKAGFSRVGVEHA
jgi:hypothetical protein